MDITSIIELLPETVKLDIIDFNDVKMKTGAAGIRVTLDRLLTETEKQKMQKFSVCSEKREKTENISFIFRQKKSIC